MATAFTVIVLFAGAAIDFGRGVNTHGSMQDAADSTALAAASMDGNASQSDQIAMAEKVFANNYSQTVTDSATTVVSFDGENITVEAKADVGTTFMAAAKVDKIPVSVSSTAWRGRRDPICVLALDPSGAAAFNVRGQGQLELKNCAGQTNSDHSETHTESLRLGRAPKCPPDAIAHQRASMGLQSKEIASVVFSPHLVLSKHSARGYAVCLQPHHLRSG